MSTPGKVLVVLVALGLVGWTLLFAMVGKLNRNWGEKVTAAEQETPPLTQRLAESTAASLATESAIFFEKSATGQELRLLRTQVEDGAVRLSNAREAALRVQLQRDGQEALVVTSKAAAELRAKQKGETEEELAASLADLQKKNEENAQLLARLGELRQEFQTVQADNLELRGRALGATAPSGAAPRRVAIGPAR